MAFHFDVPCSAVWLCRRCRWLGVRPGTGRRPCSSSLCCWACGCRSWNGRCSTSCWSWPRWPTGITAPASSIRCASTSIGFALRCISAWRIWMWISSSSRRRCRSSLRNSRAQRWNRIRLNWILVNYLTWSNRMFLMCSDQLGGFFFMTNHGRLYRYIYIYTYTDIYMHVFIRLY